MVCNFFLKVLQIILVHAWLILFGTVKVLFARAVLLDADVDVLFVLLVVLKVVGGLFSLSPVLKVASNCWMLQFNPFTRGTFCKKCVFWTFWCFISWISAKLALNRLKMRLHHSSLPCWPPASRFTTLWLGHAQKSKFWVTYVFRLFDFWNLFSPSFFSPFPFFLL